MNKQLSVIHQLQSYEYRVELALVRRPQKSLATIEKSEQQILKIQLLLCYNEFSPFHSLFFFLQAPAHIAQKSYLFGYYCWCISFPKHREDDHRVKSFPARLYLENESADEETTNCIWRISNWKLQNSASSKRGCAFAWSVNTVLFLSLCRENAIEVGYSNISLREVLGGSVFTSRFSPQISSFSLMLKMLSFDYRV